MNQKFQTFFQEYRIAFFYGAILTLLARIPIKNSTLDTIALTLFLIASLLSTIALPTVEDIMEKLSKLLSNTKKILQSFLHQYCLVFFATAMLSLIIRGTIFSPAIDSAAVSIFFLCLILGVIGLPSKVKRKIFFKDMIEARKHEQESSKHICRECGFYSFLRLSTGADTCPRCDKRSLVLVNSPEGKKLYDELLNKKQSLK